MLKTPQMRKARRRLVHRSNLAKKTVQTSLASCSCYYKANYAKRHGASYSSPGNFWGASVGEWLAYLGMRKVVSGEVASVVGAVGAKTTLSYAPGIPCQESRIGHKIVDIWTDEWLPGIVLPGDADVAARSDRTKRRWVNAGTTGQAWWLYCVFPMIGL